MTAAAPALNKMRRQVDAAIYARVCAAWTGELLNLGDAARALEYAKGYFEVGEPEPDLILDLATCLLDYAFVNQARQSSRSLVFPQTATDGGFELAVRQEMVALEQRRDRAVAVRENRSLQQLSTSLRMAGTVGLAAAWIVTGQVVFVPMIAVLWLMTWMLVSRKLLEEQPEPEPTEMLERALDDLGVDDVEDEVQMPTGRPALLERLGPVWPFVAPGNSTGFPGSPRPRGLPPKSDEEQASRCCVCDGLGDIASTYEGRPICFSCRRPLR